MEFLSKYCLELIFGLISAGALGFCKYLHSQLKEYKKLLAAREIELVEKTVDEKIEPILDKLKELQFAMSEISEKESKDVQIILRSWRFRIIQLCEIFLEQGYMTKNQFTQLSEMYSLYHQLGGNGQVTDYYERTVQLRIQTEEG